MPGNTHVGGVLSDEDANDCIDYIVCISGIHLTLEQLYGLLDTSLVAEISEWGVEDTEVGGRIANAVSLHLLDRPWPLIGDGINICSFASELQGAARMRGYALAEMADDDMPAAEPDLATSDKTLRTIKLPMIVGEDRPSLLERLTTTEQAALLSWSREQKPSSPGGSIDLTAWPGWAAALHRVQADSSSAWGAAHAVINRVRLNSNK